MSWKRKKKPRSSSAVVHTPFCPSTNTALRIYSGVLVRPGMRASGLHEGPSSQQRLLFRSNTRGIADPSESMRDSIAVMCGASQRYSRTRISGRKIPTTAWIPRIILFRCFTGYKLRDSLSPSVYPCTQALRDTSQPARGRILARVLSFPV